MPMGTTLGTPTNSYKDSYRDSGGGGILGAHNGGPYWEVHAEGCLLGAHTEGPIPNGSS